MILFISTHNLATNPRLVKEIELALLCSYKVEVICFNFRNWSYSLNEEIVEKLKRQGVKFHVIEAGRENFFNWLLSVATEKINYFLSFFIKSERILANAVSRRNYLLLKVSKKIKNADLVVGHNPGALYAVKETALRLKCKAGFDVEDYHPGEGNNKHLHKLMKELLKRVLPQVHYVSFASPLIMDEIKTFVENKNDNWILVLNYFSAKEFQFQEQKNSGKLKLVWFSQNINSGRGLELVLPAIKDNPSKMELHLYGNVNINFKNKYLLAENIIIHEPLPQSLLHNHLSMYDIGLALEPAKDLNNDLALSNKILAYFQSGIYILATNTSAQRFFLDSCNNAGIYFDYKNDNSQRILNLLIKDLAIIRKQREFRFYSNNLNWENESQKLKQVWIQWLKNDSLSEK